jgi:hypothetical protein
MKIDDIVESIRSNRIRITDHADEEAQSDNLSFHEIFLSIFQGDIIENYPDDKPYPMGRFNNRISTRSRQMDRLEKEEKIKRSHLINVPYVEGKFRRKKLKK